jgi:hypothetical protein
LSEVVLWWMVRAWWGLEFALHRLLVRKWGLKLMLRWDFEEDGRGKWAGCGW